MNEGEGKIFFEMGKMGARIWGRDDRIELKVTENTH